MFRVRDPVFLQSFRVSSKTLDLSLSVGWANLKVKFQDAICWLL